MRLACLEVSLRRGWLDVDRSRDRDPRVEIGGMCCEGAYERCQARGVGSAALRPTRYLPRLSSLRVCRKHEHRPNVPIGSAINKLAINGAAREQSFRGNVVRR